MNAILIPFFLAADIVANNTSEWTFGPEYLYDLNISYIVKPEPDGPLVSYQMINTVNCRPKMPDHLSCHYNNGTILQFVENNNTSEEWHMDEMFEIKFNERGVEGVIVEPNTDEEMVDVIRTFASLFIVAVDRSKIDMSHFMMREYSSMGNCATTYSVTHEKPETSTTGDFRLVVLPLVDAKSGTTLSIEKSRTECIDVPRRLEKLNATLEIGRFVTKIQIEPNRFETFSEIDIKLTFSESEFGVWSTRILMDLNLNSIEPAKNELPMLPYGKLSELNTKHAVPNNMID
ncbi:PREDICTED: uncharacterized protein LOC105558016 isoform X1 [Vollenhovia emeryi]|uniref:uncharacterized protein LOC105558016 isoform X1 n=1 Tax=Vollenhovia emeryi TaxID=411798 RepID=UPI0005F361B2|nr:PREDICTED: uncharacterized protein LOC105558016 isoform X1 [Vollenhovia emeryi]